MLLFNLSLDVRNVHAYVLYMVFNFNKIIFILFNSFIYWSATLHHLQGQLLDIVVIFFSLLLFLIFLEDNLLRNDIIFQSLNQRGFILIVIFLFFLFALVILFIVIIFVTATVFYISIFIAWNHSVCRFHLGDRNYIFALWRIFKDNTSLNYISCLVLNIIIF